MPGKPQKPTTVRERLGAAAYRLFAGKTMPTKHGIAMDRLSLEDIGRIPKSMRTGKNAAQASIAIEDPYRDPTMDSPGQQLVRQRGGRVFGRWTMPFRGYGMPILEIPTNRIQRYLACLEYYTTEDLVNASLNMKIEFALANHQIHVEVDSDMVPIWMPLDEIPDQSSIHPDARTPNRTFIAQHIKKKLEGLKAKLDLDRWNQNFWLEAGIYGDGFANIVDGLEENPYEDDYEEDAPALQTLAIKAKAKKATAQDKRRYAQALKDKTKRTEAATSKRKALSELAKIVADMEAVEETYNQAYSTAFKAGKLLQDKADREATKADSDIVVVSAGAVQIHVGPNLLKKAEKVTEAFDPKAEEQFKKLNALAKKRDALLKANVGTLGKSYTISAIQTLNPSAVWETRNDVGEVVRMELVKRIGVDANPLVIDDQIHIRWAGSDYTTYGISDIFPAFRSIKLKRSLEEAIAAYAERYSQPIIQCAVGETANDQMYAAMEILMGDAENLFRSYDRRSVLVTPWHYKISIIGTDGKPLRLDIYLNYAVERMLTALGVSKTFLWGDGSNYATARTQFQAMVNRLKSLQFKSDRVLSSRIYGRFLERRGYLDGDGGKIVVSCTFENNDLDSEETVAKLMTSMAAVSTATGNPLMLSETTMLEMLGQDIDIEHQNKLREAAKLMKLRAIAPGQAPNQDPNGAPGDPTQLPVSTDALPPAPPAPGKVRIPNDLYLKDQALADALSQLVGFLEAESKNADKVASQRGTTRIGMDEAVIRLQKQAQAKKKALADTILPLPADPTIPDPLHLDDRPEKVADKSDLTMDEDLGPKVE